LHQNGIAHRDIKPANLTVRSYDPPDAQIIDFGCASFESPILYDRCGTIPYLAPEQKDGVYHTQAVDIWAAGLVGIELMGYRKSMDKVTETSYNDIRSWMGKRMRHPLAPCCISMLRYDAADRCSAADAISKYLKGYFNEPEKGHKHALPFDSASSAKRPSAVQ
jgi:serine/threonine protein kinase